MLPYRALYIYYAATHVSFAAINSNSQDNNNNPDVAKFSHHDGTEIGSTHPPKHNDRFANTLSTLTVSSSETVFQQVFIQEILLEKQQYNSSTPLLLPNSSRGSPLV